MTLSHHGDEQRESELQKMFQEQRELVSSRKWPNGRISGDDDGQLVFKIGSDPEKELVYLEFPKPVTWTAMPPQQAIELAQLLIRHARGVSKEPLRIVLN